MSDALLSIAGSEVRRNADGGIWFVAGMAIDADGANGQASGRGAYHPDASRGLDFLGNAGSPGDWWALVTDNGKRSGNPIVQRATDPAPGFFVSTTALEDTRRDRRDPRRYVDSEAIPFIVVPGDRFARFGVHLGNRATLTHLENGKTVEAIVGDTGPWGKLGEASIAAARALGINADPKRGGTEKRVVRYTIYPGAKSPLWPLA